MRRFDPRATAASWKRPYTAMQWAWIRALGIDPAEDRGEGASSVRRAGHRRREIREAMGQRHGVRGL